MLDTVVILEGENRIWSLLFKDGLFVLMFVCLVVHNRLCFVFSKYVSFNAPFFF